MLSYVSRLPRIYRSVESYLLTAYLSIQEYNLLLENILNVNNISSFKRKVPLLKRIETHLSPVYELIWISIDIFFGNTCKYFFPIVIFYCIFAITVYNDRIVSYGGVYCVVIIIKCFVFFLFILGARGFEESWSGMMTTSCFLSFYVSVFLATKK